MRRCVLTRIGQVVRAHSGLEIGTRKPLVNSLPDLRRQHHVSACQSPWQPELVVFDQHGTLVDIQVWEPWIQRLSHRLELDCGLELQQKIFTTLDVCHFTKKIRHGILAEGTSGQIKLYLERLLHSEGLSWRQAQVTVENCWDDCPTSGYVDKEAKSIFEKLKSEGAKIALCSSDDRAVTLETLHNSNLIGLVDHMICGNDEHVTKECLVSEICAQLGIGADKTVVIGDTVGDMLMGRKAKTALNIGVLGGSSTRLNLTGVADIVSEDISQAVNYLNSLSENQIEQISLHRPEINHTSTDASLVIFDKDGTLLCFNSMWTPFAEDLCTKLEAITGLAVGERLLYELGFCTTRRTWRPAVFTEGTTHQSINTVADLLEEEGMLRSDALEVTKRVWSDTEICRDTVRAFDSPASIFKTLQTLGIKVAVCTSDCRQGTEDFLREQQADQYVDLVVCGNDPHSIPKPDAHNAIWICDKLGVDPAKTVMVGDTSADMELGRNAKLGATVAVLTGVGDVEHLTPDADHMVPSARHVIDIVTSREHREYAKNLYHQELKSAQKTA